jgi:N-lysine methyltransferase SETD6
MHPNPHFSLETYHIMGSRILSRSFQVEAWSPIGQNPPHKEAEMNVEGNPSSLAPNHNAESDPEEMEDDDDSDDDDDPGNVAMVPMADMLNARYGCENVRAALPLEY